MKKTIPLSRAIFMSVVSVALAVLLTLHITGVVYSPTRKIAEIDKLVKDNYLFETDETLLEDTLATAYMQVLDDEYSMYYNPEAYEEKQNDFEGQSGGLGINLIAHPKTGMPTIIYVSRNSPAKQAGIKAGDTIVRIGKENTADTEFSEVVEKLGGEIGDKKRITLLRGEKQVTVKATLGEYEIDSVRFRKIGKIGYIQITEFNEATTDQFKTALDRLKAKNVEGLVFDLRNNPGGTVSSCIEILDMLLPRGDLLRVKTKDGKIHVQETSNKKQEDLSMAVIINGESASCAEIFAMNIRDFEKGKLVGDKSYGKGIVQTTYELTDGTAVKFTVSKVVDKNGKSYHDKGLKPDIKVSLTQEQASMFYLLEDSEDPQLAAAIESISNQN